MRDEAVVTDAPNPYAATTLELSKPIVEAGGHSPWIRWLVIIAIPLLITASAAAVMNVHSIVVSGPILLLYGAVLMYLSWWKKQRRFRWFAWACCTFPMAVYLIIFTLQWSPTEAQMPISLLCCVFTLLVTAGTLATFAGASEAANVEQAAMGSAEPAGPGNPSTYHPANDDSLPSLPSKAP